MKFIRRLALLCGILMLLALPRLSLGVGPLTPSSSAVDALHRTHLPHARAASSACEYAFAGENAQPQAQLCPGEVAPTSIAAPRIARVGAGSHLGTPRDLLGSDGTVRWSAAYTAWGKIHEEYVADTQGPRGPPTEPIRSPFRLLGQYYDEETGLSATRFRMWEAETGRWLSPDPLGVFGGRNLCAFNGAPSSSVDPLGLWSVIIDGYTIGSYNDVGSHHIIQNAAVRDLPGYQRSQAIAVDLGGINDPNSPHRLTRPVQRQAGGGTYAAERRIAYKALRTAGVPQATARKMIAEADKYMLGIGVTACTQTRIPGDR